MKSIEILMQALQEVYELLEKIDEICGGTSGKFIEILKGVYRRSVRNPQDSSLVDL